MKNTGTKIVQPQIVIGNVSMPLEPIHNLMQHTVKKNEYSPFTPRCDIRIFLIKTFKDEVDISNGSGRSVCVWLYMLQILANAINTIEMAKEWACSILREKKICTSNVMCTVCRKPMSQPLDCQDNFSFLLFFDAEFFFFLLPNLSEKSKNSKGTKGTFAVRHQSDIRLYIVEFRTTKKVNETLNTKRKRDGLIDEFMPSLSWWWRNFS